jgi:hypothetical protein
VQESIVETLELKETIEEFRGAEKFSLNNWLQLSYLHPEAPDCLIYIDSNTDLREALRSFFEYRPADGERFKATLQLKEKLLRREDEQDLGKTPKMRLHLAMPKTLQELSGAFQDRMDAEARQSSLRSEKNGCSRTASVTVDDLDGKEEEEDEDKDYEEEGQDDGDDDNDDDDDNDMELVSSNCLNTAEEFDFPNRSDLKRPQGDT